MKKSRFLLVLFSVVFFHCKEKEPLKTKASFPIAKKEDKIITKSIERGYDTLFIFCDSIYPGKNYFVSQIKFNDTLDDENIDNTIFIFGVDKSGIKTELFRDSIFSQFLEIEFKDFNNDSVPDILVENTSSARSNLTYYLYLMCLNKNKVKKIRKFETIPNPDYNKEYNIVDNYVLTGINYTNFYSIVNNKIIDYHITIEDNQSEDPNSVEDNQPNPKYFKAIKKIMRSKTYKMANIAGPISACK